MLLSFIFNTLGLKIFIFIKIYDLKNHKCDLVILFLFDLQHITKIYIYCSI